MNTPAQADELKMVKEFSHRVPDRNGKRPHPSYWLRQIMKGSPTPSGERIRLKAVRIGGNWFTRDSWISEWIDALTRAHLPPDAAGEVVPPADRLRAAEEAGRQLELAGR